MTLSSRLRRIGDRDGWRCWLCLQPVDPKEGGIHRPSADRLIPGCDGGTYRPSNVRLAHQSCNSYRAQFHHVHEEPFAPISWPRVERILALL